ncbi:hypothetical protein [Minwuia thermotolerans]|uniref:hypothetical protein n=1 Tax=Minwuia thermotolerans TaxID=2056226 RepID=UPI000F63544A|nr:hypothetical protein [Minwuia thermotolerans]
MALLCLSPHASLLAEEMVEGWTVECLDGASEDNYLCAVSKEFGGRFEIYRSGARIGERIVFVGPTINPGPPTLSDKAPEIMLEGWATSRDMRDLGPILLLRKGYDAVASYSDRRGKRHQFKVESEGLHEAMLEMDQLIDQLGEELGLRVEIRYGFPAEIDRTLVDRAQFKGAPLVNEST